MCDRDEFKGLVALVTGSSRGIGFHAAEELAKRGARVILNCNKRIDEANEALRRIVKVSPDSTLIVGDVGSEKDVSRIAEEITARYDRLDILVNNAGIVEDSLIGKMTLDNWVSVITTNLTGTYLMCRACVPLLEKSASPRIVNVSSVVAQMGNIGQTNYASSKGGVISLTKTLARELARKGILVNAVAPGFISTKLTDGIPEKVRDRIMSNIPLRRFGTPDEAAHSILFLASPRNTYVTGHVLNVNGGLH